MPLRYKKRFIFISLCLLICILTLSNIPRFCTFAQMIPNQTTYTQPTNQTTSVTVNEHALHAKYAAVLDGDSLRLLYGRQADTPVPMASTTKIMTCIIALEYCSADFVCTTSKYAASMPDVQLGATRGERFILDDLLYSLMLKSHNDTAVIIAENVAYTYLCHLHDTSPDTLTTLSQNLSFLDTHYDNDSAFLSGLSSEDSKTLVSVFTSLMNDKAASLNCSYTHFVTPNGLDASDENGPHCTTAKELCTILAYCIQNKEFLKITQTRQHAFASCIVKNSQTKSYEQGISYTVSNANVFLDMYENILTGKTGFTGNAGYCYICAYQDEGRTFIVALLACGWPGNKTYKWQDCRLLLNWARENYFYQSLLTPDSALNPTRVINAHQNTTALTLKDSCGLLLSANDTIRICYDIPNVLSAPIYENTPVGSAHVYINDILYTTLPIYPVADIQALTFTSYFHHVLENFLFSKHTHLNFE